nr:hypothetical protein GCM10020185_57990 [Pseudomonas brassicacearum subsp. brassicacearum]
MRTGLVALALGLLAPIFLPALPPIWLITAMPVLALMVLPFRTYPLGFFPVRAGLGLPVGAVCAG